MSSTTSDVDTDVDVSTEMGESQGAGDTLASTIPVPVDKQANVSKNLPPNAASVTRMTIQERTETAQGDIQALDDISTAINSLEDHVQARLQDMRECVRHLGHERLTFETKLRTLEAAVVEATNERDKYQVAMTQLHQEITSTREELHHQQQKNDVLVKKQEEMQQQDERHMERMCRSARDRRLAISALSRWRKKVRASHQADTVGAKLLLAENQQLREELLICQEAAKQAFLRSASVLNSEAITMFQDAATRRLDLDDDTSRSSSPDSSLDSNSPSQPHPHPENATQTQQQDKQQPHHQVRPQAHKQDATQSHHQETTDLIGQRRQRDRREKRREERGTQGGDSGGLSHAGTFSLDGHSWTSQASDTLPDHERNSSHPRVQQEREEHDHTHSFTHTYPRLERETAKFKDVGGGRLASYPNAVPKRQLTISEYAPDSLRREARERLQQLCGERLGRQESAFSVLGFDPQHKSQRIIPSHPNSAHNKSCTCRSSGKGSSAPMMHPYRCPYCNPIQASSFGHTKDTSRMAVDSGRGSAKKKVIYNPSAATIVIERHISKQL